MRLKLFAAIASAAALPSLTTLATALRLPSRLNTEEAIDFAQIGKEKESDDHSLKKVVKKQERAKELAERSHKPQAIQDHENFLDAQKEKGKAMQKAMHELNKHEQEDEEKKRREEKEQKRKEKNAMGMAYLQQDDEPPYEGPTMRNDTLKREQMDKALGRYHPPQKTKLTEALKDFQHVIEDKTGAREYMDRIANSTDAGRFKKPYRNPDGSEPEIPWSPELLEEHKPEPEPEPKPQVKAPEPEPEPQELVKEEPAPEPQPEPQKPKDTSKLDAELDRQRAEIERLEQQAKKHQHEHKRDEPPVEKRDDLLEQHFKKNWNDFILERKKQSEATSIHILEMLHKEVEAKCEVAAIEKFEENKAAGIIDPAQAPPTGEAKPAPADPAQPDASEKATAKPAALAHTWSSINVPIPEAAPAQVPDSMVQVNNLPQPFKMSQTTAFIKEGETPKAESKAPAAATQATATATASTTTATTATESSAPSSQPSGEKKGTPVAKTVPDAMKKSSNDVIKPKPTKPEDPAITRQKEDEDKKRRERREKKALGESVLDPNDPKAKNREIVRQALEMTKEDLNADGVLQRPKPELRVNLCTLQKKIDNNEEINEGDIALDNAHQRLPSLINESIDKMTWGAHPLDVTQDPPKPIVQEVVKVPGVDIDAEDMSNEQLEKTLKQMLEQEKKDDSEGEPAFRPAEEGPENEPKSKPSQAISKPMSMQKSIPKVKQEQAEQEASKPTTRQIQVVKPDEKPVATKEGKVEQAKKSKDEAAQAAEQALDSAAAPSIKAPSLAQLSAKGVAIHLLGRDSAPSMLV